MSGTCWSRVEAPLSLACGLPGPSVWFLPGLQAGALPIQEALAILGAQGEKLGLASGIGFILLTRKENWLRGSSRPYFTSAPRSMIVFPRPL